MKGFEERTGKVEVPKNTGIEGFLLTIKEILQQHDYIQRIEINSKGSISFRYYSQEGEDERQPFKVDFNFLQPDSIIRNGEVRELLIPENASASTVIAILFEASNRERMYPVAFVSGSDSHFWKWHDETTGLSFHSRDSIYGLPFMADRHIPDSVLMLCTAHGRGAPLIDTQISYKVTMGVQHLLPPATVDIIP